VTGRRMHITALLRSQRMSWVLVRRRRMVDLSTNLRSRLWRREEAGHSRRYGQPDQTSTELVKALNDIRTAEVSCSFAIPPNPTGEQINFDAVRVNFTASSGKATTLPYSQGAVVRAAGNTTTRTNRRRSVFARVLAAPPRAIRMAKSISPTTARFIPTAAQRHADSLIPRSSRGSGAIVRCGPRLFLGRVFHLHRVTART